jgi:hypothetical protein
MDDSILTSTKKVLGLSDTYTAFDLDIITFINTAFATLFQLGVISDSLIAIGGKDEVWADLELSLHEESLVKTYTFLKVRMLFDPPTTGFLIESMESQLAEQEWRLSAFAESRPA